MFRANKDYMISFSESQFRQATAVLPDSFEDVFYCLGFEYETKNRIACLIRQVLNPYEFSVNRGVTHVEPSVEFLCKLYNELRREQAAVILQIHWHKFSEKPTFSGIDDKCAYILQQDARKINPQVRAVQIVFGNNSEYFKARYLKDKKFVYFDNLEIVGSEGIKVLPEKKRFSLFKYKPEKIFEKNVLAFSREGQEKISKTKIAVIGASGIGSGVLYQVARIGFQDVNIIDLDRITADNCNRLYFVERPRKAIGKLKTKFMAKAFKRFNPKAKVRYFTGNAKDEKAKMLLRESDLVILAVDNDSIRAVINSFCAQYCKPLVNIATGIFMDKKGNKIESAGTQIQWFIPREAGYPCLRCQGSLSQKEIEEALMSETQKENRRKAGYISNTLISPEPQVMPLNGIGISMAMWQICCWITGIRKPEPWTYYDAMQNKLIKMQVKQNSECSCCGLNELSVLALGDYKQELVTKGVNA